MRNKDFRGSFRTPYSAPRTVSILAPAKVNLFLEIFGRRPDGYHTLSTLFQQVSLADELSVSADPALAEGECRLRVEGADLAAGADNLVCRAARAFRGKFPGPGFRVLLRKRVPIGAGLGGGSSDAAAMLKAAWRLRAGRAAGALPWKKFIPMSRRLGADVPFFLAGGLAEAGGVGDRLRPLSAPGARWFVLLFPRVFVSTKWVYARLRFPLTKRRSNRTLKEKLSDGRPAREWATHLFNRLEEVVLPKVPAVARAKRALAQAGCLASLMSGSGSSVFGVVESERAGRRVAEKVRSSAWDVWLVRSQD